MAIWQEVTIAGQRADLFLPSTPREPRTAILFLHGHAQVTLRGNAAYTAELEKRGLLAICPYGGRAWWGAQISADFHPQVSPQQFLTAQVLPWLAATQEIRPPAIGLCGVSMGGQGALKLAYRHPREFPVVAAISPIVDYYVLYGHGLPLDDLYPTAEAARQDSIILNLHPLNWPRHQFILCDPQDGDWFEGTDRLVGKLRSSGIPVETDLVTRAGGHSWEYFNHQAPRVLQFLVEKTDQERLRIE